MHVGYGLRSSRFCVLGFLVCTPIVLGLTAVILDVWEITLPRTSIEPHILRVQVPDNHILTPTSEL